MFVHKGQNQAALEEAWRAAQKQARSELSLGRTSATEDDVGDNVCSERFAASGKSGQCFRNRFM
jgi:hypothetical protein